MNKPSTPPALYEQDLHAWALQQAALLRAGSPAVDAVQIAEEIEGVANAEYERLVSTLRVLLLHMLKWDHQQERRSRSWVLTIAEQRRRAERSLRRSPSLRASLDEALGDAYGEALLGAARETYLPLTVFPAVQPYAWADITDRAFPWDP